MPTPKIMLVDTDEVKVGDIIRKVPGSRLVSGVRSLGEVKSTKRHSSYRRFTTVGGASDVLIKWNTMIEVVRTEPDDTDDLITQSMEIAYGRVAATRLNIIDAVHDGATAIRLTNLAEEALEAEVWAEQWKDVADLHGTGKMTLLEATYRVAHDLALALATEAPDPLLPALRATRKVAEAKRSWLRTIKTSIPEAFPTQEVT